MNQYVVWRILQDHKVLLVAFACDGFWSQMDSIVMIIDDERDDRCLILLDINSQRSMEWPYIIMISKILKYILLILIFLLYSDVIGCETILLNI